MRLRSLSACVALLLVWNGSAPRAWSQATAVAPREQLSQRFESSVEARYDQPYAGTNNPRQQLDLFLPKQRTSNKPLPIVVYVHGGGWVSGSRESYDLAAARLVSTGNYAAASVGYRLSGEAKWPAQIHDCKAAIRWLRGQAKELNLDPDRIGVLGSSAGGHLVTMLGLTADNKLLAGELGEYTSRSNRVSCVVNFCGPSDLTIPLMQGKRAEEDDPAVTGLIGGKIEDRLEVAKEASPLNYVSATAAPFLTAHGSNDQRVNFTNAVRLDAALRQAGASSLLIEITGGGHSMGGGQELAQRVEQFLDLHLRGIAAEISIVPIPTQN